MESLAGEVLEIVRGTGRIICSHLETLPFVVVRMCPLRQTTDTPFSRLYHNRLPG